MLKNKNNSTFNEMSIKEKAESPVFKEYRRKWDENPGKNIIGKVPIHLDIELNSTCNLKCDMCFHSYDPPKAGVMDIKLFKKLIDEGSKKGLCSIKLQYRGEPLLHPDVIEAVRYAKEKGIIEVMFNTNANLLTEKIAKGLIEAGLDKIICSVDGFEPGFYESVRIQGNFNTVVKNIKRLKELKTEMNKETPLIRVQMIRLKRIKNMEEHIDKYVKFWEDTSDILGFEDEQDYDKNRNKDSYTECSTFRCNQLWQRMLVTWDGDFRLCCSDIYGTIELGNANKKSIEDVWCGLVYNTVRKLHLDGRSHQFELCKRCDSRRMIIENENLGCVTKDDK